MFLVSVADFMFRLGKIKANDEFLGVSCKSDYKIVGSNDGTNNSTIACVAIHQTTMCGRQRACTTCHHNVNYTVLRVVLPHNITTLQYIMATPSNQYQ